MRKAANHVLVLQYYEMEFYADVCEPEIDFNVYDHVHDVPLEVADFTPCFDHSHITNAAFTIDKVHMPAYSVFDDCTDLNALVDEETDRDAILDDVKVDMANFENASTGDCEICEEISSAICSAANCFAGAKEEYIMCKMDGNDSNEANDSAENTTNINNIVHHLKEAVDTETALVKAGDGVSAVQGTWNTESAAIEWGVLYATARCLESA
ncbi:hypothetical protein V8G54_001977 [Vigna mungo]|uniref:Uncharacterized protein n=1 Tax=Vigna mungo TaxID=3915 RepID=A0AAQ3SBF3_VIGMU